MAAQRTPEWHQQRLGRFTSSEIWKLMNKGRAKEEVFSDVGWTYIMEKVAETITGVSKDIPTTEEMQWGIDKEIDARKWTEFEKGWEIIETEFVQHATLNYGGSGDGWVRDINGGAEIKCLSTAKHMAEIQQADTYEEFKKNLPKRFWQVLSDAYLRNCDRIVFIWYDPRIIGSKQLVIRDWPIDQADVKYMLSRIELADAEFKKQIDFFTDKAA